MATINNKRQATKTPNRKTATPRHVETSGHLNYMAGVSYDVEPLRRLEMAAASTFFGEPKYYLNGNDKHVWHAHATLSGAAVKHLRQTLNAIDPQEWRNLNPTELMERAIDEALNASIEETLKIAVRLRNEWFIRVTPQVILVRAANHLNAKAINTPSLIRIYAKDIIQRPDELATQLSYQLNTYGKQASIPNSLKRSWRDAFERFGTYKLAKYRMESRDVKLVDVARLAGYTKNNVAQDMSPVAKLLRDELRVTGDTWEAILSNSELGTKHERWLAALPKMGHMALLRNLRNLHQEGVEPKLYLKQFIDGVKTGKQLPFRYYSAFNELREANVPAVVLDAVEDALNVSVENLPKFSGRTMSLCDNSGSARGALTSSLGSMTMANIANLMAVLTAKASEEGWYGVFGDGLETNQVRKNQSVFDVLSDMEEYGMKIGHGTENGIWTFFKHAINANQHWDNIFIYSDMQAGHGGLYGTNPDAYKEYAWLNSYKYIDVAALVRKYRQVVNPDVRVFMVQVAGYQDTLVPEFYDKSYILGGWSANLLQFAAAMARSDGGAPIIETVTVEDEQQ